MTDDNGTKTVDNTEAWRQARNEVDAAANWLLAAEDEAEGAGSPTEPAPPTQAVCKYCDSAARYALPRIGRPTRWWLFNWLRRIHAGPWRWVLNHRGPSVLCLDHFEEAQDRVEVRLQEVRYDQARHNLSSGEKVRDFNRRGLLADMGDPADL